MVPASRELDRLLHPDGDTESLRGLHVLRAGLGQLQALRRYRPHAGLRGAASPAARETRAGQERERLNVPDLIRDKLAAALAPESLSIEDESAQHVGHAGA